MKEKSYIGLASVALCVGLASACKDSAEPSGAWRAKVAGVVRDTSGNPVSGVLVTVQTMDIGVDIPLATRGRCSGVLSPSVATRSSNNGHYSVDIHGIAEPMNVCVFADAAGLSAGRLVTGGAELDSIALGPSALDSVQVDIVTRP